jgi:hypothetical protein
VHYTVFVIIVSLIYGRIFLGSIVGVYGSHLYREFMYYKFLFLISLLSGNNFTDFLLTIISGK